ncbi:MAG: hypothetical protein KC589_06960 [Nanoarchaeota archaeon]|nr:hypothetical protein [Nanoarchaeota archaeon]
MKIEIEKFTGYYILIDNIEYIRFPNGDWFERSFFGDKHALCSRQEIDRLENKFYKLIQSTNELDYLSM